MPQVTPVSPGIPAEQSVVSASKRYTSPRRFLALIAISVFAIEAVVMVLFIILPPLPEAVVALLDAALLTVLMYPILYRFVVRPINQHIDERKQAEAALSRAYDALDSRVRERTAELMQANDELSGEIAVRKRIAQQLRESETLYRTLITVSPDAVIVIDRAERITFASAQALRIFGYDYPEEMVGHSPLRGVVPGERPRVCDRVQRLLAGRQLTGSDQLWLRRKNGQHFIGEVDFASLHDDDGRPYGIVSITRDITRRVETQEALRRAHDELELRVTERTAELSRMNEALRESEAKFRTIVENSVDGITLVDEAGVVLEWNRGQEQIAGIPRDEALGQYIWDVQWRLALPEDRTAAHRQQVVDYGRQFLTDGQVPPGEHSVERPIMRPDGTLCIVQPLPTPIKTDKGYMVVNFMRDVTARKQAEELLRQSEVRFRTVANFTYDWEYWEGADRSVIFMSPSCERTTGYPAESFIADPALLHTIIHPDDRSLMVDHVHSPTDGGDLAPIDFRIIRRDGTVCWIAHVCRPVFDEQGRALGRRISNRDITGRKRAEESLREQEKLYRSIFDTTADGLAIITLEGLIVEANPAFCEMHGLAEGAAVGRRIMSLIHPTHRHWFAASVRAVKSGESFETQTVHLSKNDRPFHVETRVAGLMYYGRPHMLGVVRDVSAQVGAYMRLEERVQERTHELSMLLEFSQSMTSTLERGPLLRLILNQLRSVVDYTGAAVLSLNGQDLVYIANQSPTSDEITSRLHFPVESPLAQAVIGRLRPVIIADVQGDSPLARAFQASVGDSMHSTFRLVRSWLGIPLIITDHAVGMLAVSHVQPNYFTQRHADLALAFANQAAMAMENARLYEQAQDLAALQERQRLARDLHDSVSQTLFSASLAAQVLPRLWERDREAGQQCVNELSRLTRGALAEMRTLLVELRPNVLVETKLGDLLRQLAEAMISRTRVPVQVVVDGHAPLPPDVQVALYRIAQEALNNVAKHANADQAIVHLNYYPIEQAPGSALDNDLQCRVELSISDDGRGFSQAGISADHLGLGIMRERAEAIDAVLSVKSQIGGGTQVMVNWPQPKDSD